jgi:hypothetical protein
MKIELLPLAVNVLCFTYYLWQRAEPGKILYWLGAILLTLGLLKMKG